VFQLSWSFVALNPCVGFTSLRSIKTSVEQVQEGCVQMVCRRVRVIVKQARHSAVSYAE
jgi:hypothetical protein